MISELGGRKYYDVDVLAYVRGYIMPLHFQLRGNQLPGLISLVAETSWFE